MCRIQGYEIAARVIIVRHVVYCVSPIMACLQSGAQRFLPEAESAKIKWPNILHTCCFLLHGLVGTKFSTFHFGNKNVDKESRSPRRNFSSLLAKRLALAEWQAVRRCAAAARGTNCKLFSATRGQSLPSLGLLVSDRYEWVTRLWLWLPGRHTTGKCSA